MTVLAVSEAHATLNRLIDQTAESRPPIHVIGERTRAVLPATEDWDAIQEALNPPAIQSHG